MQPECGQSSWLFRNLCETAARPLHQLLLAWGCLLLCGCRQNVTTIDPPREQPFKNQQLRIGCSSAVEPMALVDQYVREWQLRQDLNLTLQREPIDLLSGDVVIVTAAELPLLADSKRYLPVPDSITKNREFPYQWDGLLPPFSGPIASWGGVEYGLPLLGEGHVLVYRKDRLAPAKLDPPASWDDYLAVAKALAKPERPSLPPLSKQALDLETEFYLIAASYDRETKAQSDARNLDADIYLSFQYRLKSGANRINDKPFVEALRIMRELQTCRAPGEADDACAFFADGSASLAIVSLRDLHRLQAPDSPVRGKFGVASVPGARFTFDPVTGDRTPARGGSVNRIPYLGSRILVGLVSRNCPNPTLAWEFLASLALPDKMGAEVVTAGKWGAGPFRYLHIEERGRFLWLGYDLPRDETERLISALKDQLQPGIVNQCYRLRLPNEKAHAAIFDAVVRAALLSGKNGPQAVMDDLSARWTALWKDVPDAQRRAWVRMCYGLPAQ